MSHYDHYVLMRLKLDRFDPDYVPQGLTLPRSARQWLTRQLARLRKPKARVSLAGPNGTRPAPRISATPCGTGSTS